MPFRLSSSAEWKETSSAVKPAVSIAAAFAVSQSIRLTCVRDAVHPARSNPVSVRAVKIIVLFFIMYVSFHVVSLFDCILSS